MQKKKIKGKEFHSRIQETSDMVSRICRAEWNASTCSFSNGIPFVPLKDLAVEIISSNKIFHNIHQIWNQDENLLVADKETQTHMRNAVFDKNIVQQAGSQIWDIFDITGPLSQANNTVKFMKTIAGVTLIHAALFSYQKQLMDKEDTISVSRGRGITGIRKSKIFPSTAEQVHNVIENFRKSKVRQGVCSQIEGQLNKYGLNLWKAYHATQVKNVIDDAIDMVWGGQDFMEIFGSV